MAEFINTIDVLGDDAVIDSIIDRTITEFKDDKLTKIGDYAFHGCTALTEVDLPNVTELKTYAFNGCTALEMADFGAVTSFSSSFTKCTSLISLILRTPSVVTLSGGHFSDTPIASGTGYIYVPRALIEDYKVATNWSAYADQFRALEDYTVDGTVTGELDETKI